jgi:hypothetical protein
LHRLVGVRLPLYGRNGSGGLKKLVLCGEWSVTE